MTRPDRWREARRYAAKVRRDPGKRAEILAAVRAEDADIALLVEDILDASETGGLGRVSSRAMLHRARLASLGIGPGVLIEEFELHHPLRSGGSSEVWIARQKGHVERNVALKLLTPTTREREVVMSREARALAELTHPDIAKVHGAGVHLAQGVEIPWIALEYFEGGEDFLRFCRRLDPVDRLAQFVRLCRAITYAHGRGIYHLDLKPANVLARSQQGHVELCVIDFGIATSDGYLPELDDTQELRFVGTIPYASPEQLAGERGATQSAKSDVYGLTVLLYQILTDRLPFDVVGLAPADAAMLAGTTGAAPRFADRLGGDAEWVCHKGLQRHRDDRYESVAALAKDVERLRTLKPVEARPQVWAHSLKLFAQRNRKRLELSALGAIFVAVGLGSYRSFVHAREVEFVTETGRLQHEIDERKQRNERVASKIRGEEVLARRYATEDPTGIGSVVEGRIGESQADRFKEIVDALLAPGTTSTVDFESVSERVAQATEHVVAGRNERALALLPEDQLPAIAEQTRAAVQLEKEFLSTRADALARLGQYEEALACCERILELDPFDAQMHVNHGSLLERLGRPDEALVAFDRAQTLATDVAIVTATAGALSRLGRHAEALAAFEHAAAMEPEDAINHFNQGVMLERLKREEEAVEAFRRATDRAPNDPRPWRSLSQALLGLRKWREAELAYDRVIPLVAGSALGQCRFERGQTRMFQGRLEEAVTDFDAAVRDLPGLAVVLEYKADCLDGLGRSEEVLSTLAPILLEDNRKVLPWRLQARALQRLGRHAEAIAAFDVVLSIAPSAWDALGERARSLAAVNQGADALEELSTAIERAPRNFELRYSRGFVHGTLEHVEPALEDYALAAELDREDSRPLLESGALLERAGRLLEAVAAFEQGLERSPTHGEGWCSLARVQFALGRREQAHGALSLGLERDPDSDLRRLECGLTCFELGDYEHARADLATALPGLLTSNDTGDLGRGWECLAASFVELGRVEEARSLLGAALDGNLDPELQEVLGATLRALQTSDDPR